MRKRIHLAGALVCAALLLAAAASAQTTERVSIATGGAQGNNDSVKPAVSADGNIVAFESSANNLVAGRS